VDGKHRGGGEAFVRGIKERLGIKGKRKKSGERRERV
jgi:hypothetical protein